MRRTLAVMLLVMPLAAAQAKDPVAEFAVCATNADCIVVEGICGPAAVNAIHKNEALAYFRSRKDDAKCVQKFWQPTLDQAAARCRIERCEIVGK